MKVNKIIYYSSENDEVVNFKNKEKHIDGNYKFTSNNIFLKLVSWFSYGFIAQPICFVIFRLFKRIKFHNAKILKSYKRCGYFIYANHTNQFGDGIFPHLICFPLKPKIIVNSANVSIPFLGEILKLWGAVPIPNTTQAYKNFNHLIENALTKNKPIVIYPEAHLWPYYTKIRPFPSASFRLPVAYNKPSFTFTTIYKKRKFTKTPKVEIYVDGPFFINNSLTSKAAQQDLRDKIYNKLVERASLSNYEYVKYIKRSNYD